MGTENAARAFANSEEEETGDEKLLTEKVRKLVESVGTLVGDLEQTQKEEDFNLVCAKLKEPLAQLGEPIPKDKEEAGILFEKLRLPSVREKIRARLSGES